MRNIKHLNKRVPLEAQKAYWRKGDWVLYHIGSLHEERGKCKVQSFGGRVSYSLTPEARNLGNIADFFYREYEAGNVLLVQNRETVDARLNGSTRSQNTNYQYYAVVI